MTQDQMFEASFRRPKDYFSLSAESQWAIDKSLGILDWEGGLTGADLARFEAHYDYFQNKRSRAKAGAGNAS